ncbi:MAG TPA: HEAT repeat domain-containing protein, partial [Planctomycetota bacterium]|nr:HEAT repeat domain-containing protein [Planctomycetota bacterium]
MRTLVAFAVLASAAALFAQDEKSIEDAIKGLGAESFEEREKATVELKKIGAPALQALKKAAEGSDDPEVRARAKRLVDEIAKPPARRAVPGRDPRFKGSRVSIRKIDDTTVYALQPTEGDAIEFHRTHEGKVKLLYPDGKGGKAEAEAESIEKFVESQKDLAAKYGITKDGIEYGGTKVSFSAKWPELPGLGPLEIPTVPLPPMQEFDNLFQKSEELRKTFDELRRWQRVAPTERWGTGMFGFDVIRGAQLGPVPDVLRTQLSIPEGQGVVIEAVREGTTAAAAG